jgi:hypothetical protein
MSDRSERATGGTIERWLSGPQLEPPPEHLRGAYEQPASQDDNPPERDRYDEDYDYYWGDWRVPLWLALIWQVPWRQRLDIFIIGFIIGMVIAGIAVTWGILLSRY